MEDMLWLVAAVLIIICTYIYTTRTFSTFSSVGIPGPNPWPIIGTAHLMADTNLPTHDTDMWKKYGKFVGTFAGSTSTLLVFDAEWLQEAFIKHFDILTNRNVPSFGGNLDNGILSIKGDRWRFARRLLSPVFTSGKLKQMMPIMQERCDIFCDILLKTKATPQDIRRLVNLLTLDIISSTAFGLNSNVQRRAQGDFAQNAFMLTNSSEVNASLSEKIRITFVVAMTLLAPAWLTAATNGVFNLGLLNGEATGYFETLIGQALTERTQSSDSDRSDLLQTMANNLTELPKEQSDKLRDESGKYSTTNGLTKEEVIGNSILFLFAGFQTTADSMMFIFYELAHHPDIQQRLYEEILSVCKEDDSPSIEQVNKLTYLDYCVKEAMRLYPQGFRFDRYATADIDIQGVRIPQGTTVVASSWVIHRNPEYWQDPLTFDPDRFSPGRFSAKCSQAYMPFGIGNRSCIGSRLAMLEMKLAVLTVVKNFIIKRNELTPERPIQFANAAPLTPLLTKELVMLSFIHRT